MTGKVTDEAGEPLIGATVIATHTPSGTQYGTVTDNVGRFALINLRVGGPYQITTSYIGYQVYELNNIILSLGNTFNLPVKMTTTATVIEEIVIASERKNLFSSDRTGATTNISNQVVQSVPTINRGLRDFTKLSPLANTSGNGTSFAGSNNRYNQFAIDGLVNNDVFGLAASGTNGGQTGIEPISLDAIEEFQINIAPYDVRQGGFTGGGINAVTKSGTNKFNGSVFAYGNNQALVGKVNPLTGLSASYPPQKDYQAGFSLGGPIIKNKLFFFVNGEITRKKFPLSAIPGTGESKIKVEEVERVIATMKRIAPNYDLGSYKDIENETNSNKVLAKINWNISDKHKLVLRHSYTFGENIDNSRSATSLRFYNNGQYFPSTTNSSGIELSSILSNKLSNKFMLGYTRVRDDRDPLGDPFSAVTINIGDGRQITLGSEYSSVANQLDQDIISIDDDVNFYLGKHTFTVGTHNEIYKFYNIFVQNIYGSYTYKTLENFESIGTANEVAPTFYGISYSFDPNDNPSQSKGAAEFKAMQLGFYIQDDYQATDNLKVTAGLRFDLPIFNDSPLANETFNTAYSSKGVKTGQLPKTNILYSPRIGFNWDVLGNKSLQLRGGTGIFTGRVPFVWISNQFTNNGQVNGTYSVGNSSSSSNPISDPAGIKFVADPSKQKLAEDLGKTPGRGAINVVSEDFKFPQVFRSNLAIDQKLPFGIIGTIEGIFSKTLNNINFINLNRKIDSTYVFDGTDKRPRFVTGRTDSKFEEIIKLENTNEGYSYNIMAQLQKEFAFGLNAMVAYSYGQAFDLNSGTSSVAYSNWRYVNNVNGLNNLELTPSNFSPGSRFVSLISYKLSGSDDRYSTQFSLFYNGQSGQPISYIYDGDLNNDGTTNDLIYIPKSDSDIKLVETTYGGKTLTVADQWKNLDAFIESDEYLKNNRGSYAKRNGSRIPFSHNFDIRVLQEVNYKNNKLQFTFDVMNIGNLLNSDWGKIYFASNQQISLIKYDKILSNTKTPSFNYTGATLINSKPYSIADFSSRWRAQIGLKFIF